MANMKTPARGPLVADVINMDDSTTPEKYDTMKATQPIQNPRQAAANDNF